MQPVQRRPRRRTLRLAQLVPGEPRLPVEVGEPPIARGSRSSSRRTRTVSSAVVSHGSRRTPASATDSSTRSQQRWIPSRGEPSATASSCAALSRARAAATRCRSGSTSKSADSGGSGGCQRCRHRCRASSPAPTSTATTITQPSSSPSQRRSTTVSVSSISCSRVETAPGGAVEVGDAVAAGGSRSKTRGVPLTREPGPTTAAQVSTRSPAAATSVATAPARPRVMPAA